jgi:hypothetical protein
MSIANTDAPPLADRADVHKSCKSLETLLGVLNDYCEAVGAMALLQKKLAKALRETAGLKVTKEIPGASIYVLSQCHMAFLAPGTANAMNISASIFETLSDIDSKFSKFVDKEYDTVSTEVRKWFKKLAVSTPLISPIIRSPRLSCERRKKRKITMRKSRKRTLR